MFKNFFSSLLKPLTIFWGKLLATGKVTKHIIEPMLVFVTMAIVLLIFWFSMLFTWLIWFALYTQ